MTPTRPVLPLLLTALAGSALLAGCGGSDGLSKSDYVAKAEALCKKANDDIDALTTPSDLTEIGPFLDKLITTADQTTDELVALDPPSDDKADLDGKFLDPLKKQVEQGRTWAADIKAAATANDQAKIAQLLGNAPTMAEADLGWMKTYGFKECVETAETDQ